MTEEPVLDARTRFIDINLPGWLAARRYGMPASMVEQATQRRLVGDWLGATAAAGVDVCFRLDEVRRTYGIDVAAQLGDDLLHLAPDLLRWHAPRHVRGGLGLLWDNRTLLLARYGDGAEAPWLTAHTPPHYERPQRLELRLGPRNRRRGRRRVRLVGEDWSQARYLWDARAADGLRFRLGGGDRTPFFHRDGRPLSASELSAPRPDDPVAQTERVMLLQDDGEIEAAWRAGGVPLAVERSDKRAWQHRDLVMPETFSAMVPALARAARAVFASPSAPDRLVVIPQYGWGSSLLLLVQEEDGLRAYRSSSYEDEGLPALPRPLWRRLPDLELLRTGHLRAEHVHPLVRAALFPDAPDPGYQPLPMPTVDRTEVRVRCRGQWHRVGWRNGRTAHLDHSDEEAQREAIMRSLGGPVPACFTVAESWRGTVAGRLPGPLRRLRSHALTAVMHGRTDELQRLLDAGIDPAGIVDRWDNDPLHHLGKMDDPLALLPRLLAAGLDINGRNGKGRTPLGCVLFDGAPAALVRAMLDAGADPTALDGTGNSMLHLLRSTEAETIVPWLVAAGVSLDAYNEYGRTPLPTQILAMAPPAAIRATLAAGADLTKMSKYDDLNVLDAIDMAERTDLTFLIDAARAAGLRPEPDEDDE